MPTLPKRPSTRFGLRIHLDDSTDSNGPLRVVAGRHTMGVLGVDAIERLAAEIKPVNCLASAGGVVASLLWSSMPLQNR